MCAIVHGIGEAAIVEPPNQPADGRFGLILNMGHIGCDGVDPIFVTYPYQFGCTLGAGGDLGGQVGDILVDIAGGIRP